MFAASPRCRPWIGPALAAAWGLAAVVPLVGLALGLATGPWPVRATLAAGLAAAAAVWGWRNAPPLWRGWVAAAPLAGWTIGAFGWNGATLMALAAWIALRVSGPGVRPPGSPRREPRPGGSAMLHNLGVRLGLPGLGAAGTQASTRDVASRADEAPPELLLRAHDDLRAFAPIVQHDPELEEPGFEEDLEEDELEGPEPDQWLSRTADVVEGELLVHCEGGVGSAHVLFWPALPGVPRVRCHPADGLGRVRASRVLPQGVRFEVVRPDGECGPVRVCYEAAV
ncbi:hypothetical protein [Alienimonas californiensis]|nr:hypothetical protein [Alienimonas californiensis]